jgi:PTS system fructose-specific IIC component
MVPGSSVKTLEFFLLTKRRSSYTFQEHLCLTRTAEEDVMLLEDFIKAETIIPELSATDKESIIHEMAETLATSGALSDKDAFIEGIVSREAVESTAIGNGIAIPHARGEWCTHLMISFGRSSEGIEFKALDQQPVHLVFMIAAPKEAKKEYLQVIAKIARFLKHEKNRQLLTEAILSIIGDFDASCPGVETVKTKDGRVIHREMH